MEELSATSILSLFDTTKEQRKSFVSNIVNRMNNGDISALNVHIQVKCMEDIIKQLLASPEYKIFVLDEASKHDGNRFELHNSEVSIKETGVRYDYVPCGDPVYMQLAKKFALAQEALKEREDFLKKIPKKGLEILHEDGELIKIYPPYKSSTTSVVISLK